MSFISKYMPIHKRMLDYFGYTLLEAQKLPEAEKDALRDRIQSTYSDCCHGVTVPRQLLDENCTFGSPEYDALDDLMTMIYWLPGRTVLKDDGNLMSEDEALELMQAFPKEFARNAYQQAPTRPLCANVPMPACNYDEDVALCNVGFTQGILEDGTPFVAELCTEGTNSLVMNIVLPELPQYISNKNAGLADDFPDSMSEATDNGIISLGMGIRERASSFEELMYYTQYLEDMGVIMFVGNVMEGCLETLYDLNGSPVVLDRITLVDNGVPIAMTHLEFKPFEDGPNRFFEEEWVRKNFDSFRIDDLLSQLGGTSSDEIVPGCVLEDGEWRPYPYDYDPPANSWSPSSECDE